MGIPVGPNHDIGTGRVHDITRRRFYLSQNQRPGSEIGYPDFAVAVRGENAVLGKGGGTDHAVQADLTACRRGQAELSAGEGLAADTVPFLDDQFSLGLVLEGQSDRAALLDLDGLGLRVDDESVRGPDLSHDDALSGLQPRDPHFAVFIAPVDAVGITDERSVCIGDFELGVLEGDAGIDSADLADQQISVRRIVKADRDNALLTAVGQVYRFGGVDDGVPVGGIDLFDDIGPTF